MILQIKFFLFLLFHKQSAVTLNNKKRAQKILELLISVDDLEISILFLFILKLISSSVSFSH